MRRTSSGGGIAVSDRVAVGVAALQEAGPHAFSLRAEWGVPASGHALITADRVLLHLEGARKAYPEPLHGWLTTGETAIGIGRVLPGQAGWVLEGPLPEGAGKVTGVWVTAGPVEPEPLPLLRGELVWLAWDGAEGDPAVEAAAEAEEPVVVALSVAEPLTEEEPAEAEVEESAGPAGEADGLVVRAPAEEAVEPLALAPAAVMLAPEAAVPWPEAAPGPRVVTLTAAHPSAPRAAGSAALDLAHGGLTLIARGLPAPAALGADPATGRAYNAYRVWLVGPGGRQRVPAGLCTRVWGDHFRCQIDAGLPLAACDAVVVAPADRANPQPALGSMRVLEGQV